MYYQSTQISQQERKKHILEKNIQVFFYIKLKLGVHKTLGNAH